MDYTLSFISDQLRESYPEAEAKAIARRLLESVCALSRHDLLLGKDTKISEDKQAEVQRCVEELLAYRPLQYVLGEAEFYGLRLRVDERVLIPRPETEELIELILASTPTLRPSILDIGTGSGCIAIALARALPQASVYAMDVSAEALEVASANARLNKTDVRFFQADVLGDWHQGNLPAQWDMIVSNPPYITPEEKASMQANVLNHEPHKALFVPQDQPLLFYEKIAEAGLTCLSPDGYLFFETSSLYGQATADRIHALGYRTVELYKDISGRDRMIKAKL